MLTISRRKIATHIANQLAAGAAIAPVAQQAAAYLMDHKQLQQAELLIRDVEAILSREHGIVLAEVVSARELSTSLLQTIEQFIARSERAKRVELVNSVDPSLLGGVIIKTPRSEMDTTIRKQLNELRA